MKLSWVSSLPLIAITLVALSKDDRVLDDPRSVAPHLVRPVMLSNARLPSEVPSADLARQYEFLSALPNVWVDYAPTGVVRQIWGETGLVLPNAGRDLKVGDSAAEILNVLAPALLATGSESLRVTHINNMLSGDLVIKTEQFIRDIPVRYATVNLQVDPATGTIELVRADFVPDRGLPGTPEVSAAEAVAILLKELSADPRREDMPDEAGVGEPTLAYAPGTSGRIDNSGRFGRLVWCISFGRVTSREEAWVDAIEGTVVAVRPLTFSAAELRGPVSAHSGPAR